MSVLRSDLFCGDCALQAALTVDAGHIVKGARGPHVSKIQAALTLLLNKPPCVIADAEIAAGLYGGTTAAAVLRYKTENWIINPAYQATPDKITGKKTMRALDDAMAGVETEFAADMLGILARLDQLLVSEQLALSPELRARFDLLKITAQTLMAPGGLRLPGGRFAQDYQCGLQYMDAIARGYRPPIVFAVVPLVVGAGAAIAVFLLAIATVIALILLMQLMTESNKLGNQVNQAIQGALDTGEAAILENIAVVELLDQAVEQCRRRSQNGTPACLAALAKFAAKKLDVVANRNDLQSILKDLRDSLKGSPKKFVWKLLARRAEAAGKALARTADELRDIAREIIKECGCQFIKV